MPKLTEQLAGPLRQMQVNPNTTLTSDPPLITTLLL